MPTDFFLRSISQDHCKIGTKCEQFTYFMGNSVFETCYLHSFEANSLIYDEFIRKNRRNVHTIWSRVVKFSKNIVIWKGVYFGYYFFSFFWIVLKIVLPMFDCWVYETNVCFSISFRTTLFVLGAFLDSFQKIADAATNTKGKTKNS